MTLVIDIRTKRPLVLPKPEPVPVVSLTQAFRDSIELEDAKRHMQEEENQTV